MPLHFKCKNAFCVNSLCFCSQISAADRCPQIITSLFIPVPVVFFNKSVKWMIQWPTRKDTDLYRLVQPIWLYFKTATELTVFSTVKSLPQMHRLTVSLEQTLKSQFCWTVISALLEHCLTNQIWGPELMQNAVYTGLVHKQTHFNCVYHFLWCYITTVWL